jgi:8-oxo-dGTP diphosphatase
MIKLIYRIFGSFLGRFIDTDRLADHFPVSVKALIKEEGKVLVLLNERGEWDFPGGKLEKATSIIETLIEEVKEETNLSIQVGKLLYIEKKRVYRTDVIVIVYEAHISAHNAIKISHEHFDYRLAEPEALLNELSTPEWVKVTVKS